MGLLLKINRENIKLVVQSLLNEFIEHRPFPQGNSAQQAELFALTRRACVIAWEKLVNIYTDSCCAFGVEHGFGMLWKQRGFPTSSGTPIQKRV